MRTWYEFSDVLNNFVNRLLLLLLGLKGLPAVHARLESNKAEADSLNEALKVSWKAVAATKGKVKE